MAATLTGGCKTRQPLANSVAGPAVVRDTYRVRVVRHASPRAWLDRVREFLAVREPDHALVAGIVASLARGAPADDVFLATVEESDRVRAIAVRTPPRKLVTSYARPEAISALAAELAKTTPDLSGVIAPPAVAEQFATEFARATGTEARPGHPQIAFTLTHVEKEPGPGALRTAVEGDLSWLVEWARGFANDVALDDITPEDAEHTIARRVEAQSMFVWEHERVPVSMAACAPQTPSSARIAFVYTPPGFRRRGFASSIVSALSDRALRNGAAFCSLTTEADNRTSNHIYQAIGYRVEGELMDYAFVGR
jgi:predicted GNAT family acetyltransferase